jgi:hypothetical protein
MVHLCAEPPVRGLFKLQRAPLVPMWSRGGHGLESELPTGLAAALGPNIAMKRVFSVKTKLRSKKRKRNRHQTLRENFGLSGIAGS